MQAYMRSPMPYHGVPAPEVRRICRSAFAGLSFDGADPWQAMVRGVWTRARFREERYAAIELTGLPAARAFQRPAALPLYEELIVSGAWWDYVDALAIQRVGPILRSFPKDATPVIRRWSRSNDLWLRRSAIICQVGSKSATDRALLVACIAPALGEREFFLRKAIGWALRQYARVAPDWVLGYVRRTGNRLSPLSRREALRHLSGPTEPHLPLP